MSHRSPPYFNRSHFETTNIKKKKKRNIEGEKSHCTDIVQLGCQRLRQQARGKKFRL